MLSLERITKYLLYFTLLIPPLSIAVGLLFPFVSGKAYLFRLGVELALFFWAILLVRKPEFRPRVKNLLITSGFLYIVAMSITAFLGVDWVHSFFSEIERADGILQFIHWYLYFLMLVSVLRTKKDWDYFIKAFLALAGIISLFAWGQHFSSSRFFFYGHKVGRLEGTFGNPDYLPAFLLFALGYSAYYFFKTLKEKSELYRLEAGGWGALFAFFFLTFLFTQTRGAYVGFLAGALLVIVLFSLYYRKEYKKVIISFWVLVLIGAIAWAGLFSLRHKPFVKNNSLLYRLVDVTPRSGSSLEGRLLTWKISFAAIKAKPIFGWGPENFAEPFSRFYYIKGTKTLDAWFDKVHNQFIQVLVEGGLFQFSFYLFWIFSVFYLIFKTLKKSDDKLLPIFLAATYLAFLVQDFFLFDTFPLYLGLWPFLGLVYFVYESSRTPSEKEAHSKKEAEIVKKKDTWYLYPFYVFWTILILFILTESVWLPYKSNKLIRDYTRVVSDQRVQNRFAIAESILKQAIEINSPYTRLDAIKRGGWGLLNVLNGQSIKNNDSSLQNLYNYVTDNLELILEKHSFDPQIYYILGQLYSMGGIRFHKKELLTKAEEVLKKGLKFSPHRTAFAVPLARTYMFEGRKETAQNLIEEYAKEYDPDSQNIHLFLSYIYLANNDFDKAEKEFDWLIEHGFAGFWQSAGDYSRYVYLYQNLKDYNKIKEVSLKRVKYQPKDYRAWYNLALAYKKLGEDKQAKKAFEKALELNKNYYKYRSYFEAITTSTNATSK